MYFQNSLYNSTNLNLYIENYFKQTEIKKHLNIGLANVLNGILFLITPGSFINFDEHTSHNDMMKVLQASLSFPGVFLPIEAFNSLWFSNQ
jgi:hypothetical protein